MFPQWKVSLFLNELVFQTVSRHLTLLHKIKQAISLHSVLCFQSAVKSLNSSCYVLIRISKCVVNGPNVISGWQKAERCYCLFRIYSIRQIRIMRLVSVIPDRFTFLLFGVQRDIQQYFSNILRLFELCLSLVGSGDILFTLCVCLSVCLSVWRPVTNVSTLVNATHPTILNGSFWNFAGVLFKVWRCAWGLPVI